MTHSALSAFLERRGLRPSTIDKYQSIAKQSFAQPDPIEWVEGKVLPETPIGTVLPLRAAMKHYLMAEHGYSEEDLKQLLPGADGARTRFRSALSTEQLVAYHEEVAQLKIGSIRTILDLLPKSGLRIGELCTMESCTIQETADGWQLTFKYEGNTERIVPVLPAAALLLEEHMLRGSGTPWLFPGYKGAPLTQHAVRVYTREMSKKRAELAALTPHKLRHTFALMMSRNGMKTKVLQQILGHGCEGTTRAYLKRLEELTA